MSRQESQHEVEERDPLHGKKGPRKAKPFGIRYAYTRWFKGMRDKWYTTRAGRDQAFRTMCRENERTFSHGPEWARYKSIEKIER